MGSATASAMVGLVGLSKIGLGAAAYAAISLVLSIMLYAAIKQHRRVAVKKKLRPIMIEAFLLHFSFDLSST